MEQNRIRQLQKKLFLTPDEWDIITENMERCGTRNFSAYARKMLIDGYLVKVDFTEMRALTTELGAIGRNINQIAKMANTTGNLYRSDIRALQSDFIKIRSKIRERLVKLINEEY